MEIALFYGSTTGHTEEAAETIRNLLDDHQVLLFDLADEPLVHAESFSHLIFGIPTWDYGEPQGEWEDVWEDVENLDLQGKRVALFGLGDQVGYGDWFQDAMGLLHDRLVAAGAQICGQWPAEGYDFSASRALTADGRQFVGLALDEDSQPELSAARLRDWCEALRRDFLAP